MRAALDVLVPQDLQCDVLALQFAVNRRPIRFGKAAVTLLLADRGKKLPFQCRVGQFGCSGQYSPAAASRLSVSRTVDGATPTRRAISLPETPAALNRSTSRTWRMAILSAGIVPSCGKAEGADAMRASRGAPRGGTTRATSSRNAERDQIGMAGEIIADSRATSPGIRKLADPYGPRTGWLKIKNPAYTQGQGNCSRG